MSLFSGKSVFLAPREWTRVYLPFKANVNGKVTLVCGLERRGLVAGLSVTKGGHLRVNIWNSTRETIQLTPRTVLVNVLGAKVSIKYLGKLEEEIRD